MMIYVCHITLCYTLCEGPVLTHTLGTYILDYKNLKVTFSGYRVQSRGLMADLASVYPSPCTPLAKLRAVYVVETRASRNSNSTNLSAR